MTPIHDSENAQRLDTLLDDLKPRMATARRRHFQRIAGTAVLLPGLLLGAGAALTMGSSGDGSVQIEVAGPATDDVPASETAEVEEPGTDDETTDTETDGDVAAPVTFEVELGLAGRATFTDDGEVLVLGIVELNDGWEAIVVADEAAELVLYLEHETGSKLVAVIEVDGGEPRVHLEVPKSNGGEKPSDELAVEEPKPEPTVVEEPKPQPTPEQPAYEARKEIDVNGYGRVVVEQGPNKQLAIGILWVAEGWQWSVPKQYGEVVEASFSNEQYVKTVKAWAGADGKIQHEISVKELSPPPAETPVIEARKEIDVNGYGRVVVEQGPNKQLWIGILATAEGWQSEVLVANGDVVKAKFLNEQYVKTVKAWAGADGKIKHEILVEELTPPPAETGAYDGVVTTDFGSYGVLVQNGIATIQWVEAKAGFSYSIHQETGEYVKVNFTKGEQSWWVKAWGQNGEIVKEVYAG